MCGLPLSRLPRDADRVKAKAKGQSAPLPGLRVRLEMSGGKTVTTALVFFPGDREASPNIANLSEVTACNNFDRGKGREKERERNINVWLPLACPLPGPVLQPRHMP